MARSKGAAIKPTGRGRGKRSIVSGLDTSLTQSLLAWFEKSQRKLPWRMEAAGKRDAYWCLVSEAMLQQTQVSRVIEKFSLFVAKFPTVAALANADERDVLAAWAGLGYYRRARNLHNAAKMVMERFDGCVPAGVDQLLELPGVGRYTAGAIASIGYGITAPIVDGNVMRVLLRIGGRDLPQEDKGTQAWAWERAGQLSAAAGNRVGEFNEALMELGATICTPGAAPRCEICPWRTACVALRKGLQGRIPAAKANKATKVVRHAALVLRDRTGRILLERRGASGLWAGLWQVPTLEASTRQWGVLAAWLLDVGRGGVLSGIELVKQNEFNRKLSHREVKFEVWGNPQALGGAAAKRLILGEIGPRGFESSGLERRWIRIEEALESGVSSAQRLVITGARG